MYVSVKEPDLDVTESGSAPVSFIFKNVMENSLRYLQINPDKEATAPLKVNEIPDWAGKETEAFVNELKEAGIRPVVIGDGSKITKVSLEQGAKLTSSQKVFIATDQLKMPDMTGWSFRDILLFKDFMNLDLEWVGSGYIVKQSVEAGASFNENDYLMVELEQPNNIEESEDSSEEKEETG
ncbi:PASTA domain-containing protein [Gracilibacillus boraciitolerans]